jgi:hypothetical protein
MNREPTRPPGSTRSFETSDPERKGVTPHGWTVPTGARRSGLDTERRRAAGAPPRKPGSTGEPTNGDEPA